MERDHERELAVAVRALEVLAEEVSPRPGTVHLDLEGPVAWVRLDNPQAHNALTVGMMVELARAVARLTRWSGAVVAVRSAHGGTFCAGGHLGQVREGLLRPDAARIMAEAMTAVLDALLDLPALSVAVLEGPAIGGGAELATACDLRVGTPEAAVHFAQVGLGVACGWGGARRLRLHLGRGRALRLLAAGERLPAASLQAIGLLDHVGEGDPAALLSRVLGPALDHPVAAVRAVKAQVVSADADDATEAFLQVWGGQDHSRALSR